ncbi:MAG: AMP-binding protein [Candidatus Sericytochromatia bacterium]|nr:AMP-binding protein [Candidatus Sericytochromatia bacterium]
MPLSLPPPCENFVELLRWRAQTHPELKALSWFGDGENLSSQLSYAELDASARAWAVRLLALQPSGNRALLVFPPGPEFLQAFVGCLYAGWIPVPAYPPEQHRLEHSLKRLLAIIADAQAPVVLTVEAFRQMAGGMIQQSGQKDLKALTWLTPADLISSDPERWQKPALGPESLAFLQYTSGSTALPKGVMISHSNLLHNLAMIKAGFELGERSDTVVCWVPFYHDMGLVGHLLESLYVGGNTVLMSPLDFLRKPLRWLKLISDWRGTATGAPNFAYDLCVRKISPAERDSLDLSSLKLVLNGAEPVQHATIEKFLTYFAPAGFPRHAMYPAYGMAEATVFISGSLRQERPVYLAVSRAALAEHRVEHRVEALTAQRPESQNPDSESPDTQILVGSGRPWGDEELRVVDPQTRQDLGENHVGEIWLRGSHIAKGYWNREAETQAYFGAYLNDGSHTSWLRSGDLGFLHGGEIYVTGRIKDLIIVRGRNLYPQDLERQIETLRPAFPAIRPGCAVAVALSGPDSEQLALLLEVSLPFEAGEDLCQALVERIEATSEVAPRRILLLPPGALPKTSSGKLMRQACRQALEKDPASLKAHFSWPTLPPDPEEEKADQPLLLPVSPKETTPDSAADNTNATSATFAREQAALLRWLRQWLAEELQTTPAQINLTRPLRGQGLDSALAVRLQADLESHLKRPLSPSLLWDYPTLEKLLPALLSPDKVTQSKSPDSVLRPRSPKTQAPVAILGLACRFPGNANDPDRFWHNLLTGQDAITVPPEARFGAAGASATDAFKGGYLADIQAFDAAFFGISAREAESMDPQQRILLELAWEALENAGLLPESLKEQNVGIFIGLSGSDYAQRSLFGGEARRSGSSVTGVALSVAAGRIAYQLGTQGPTMTVDTACSSALMAVHLACQSLNSGECDLALAGAVNLILEPDVSLGFQWAGALSADGHCKSFSAAADGYVRSEGAGMVVLQRWEDHQPQHSPLWGRIRASVVNHDGLSQGLTAPNGQAQMRLLQLALERAGLQADELGYLEAHGTGTPLGDPIEVEAIHAVYGQRSPAQPPLYIGAVKSLLGHLEAAAGMAGLIKTLLILRHGVIPANLNGTPLNPRLSDFVGPLQFPGANTPWSGPRLAGVSSFGISGSNAHLILDLPDKQPEIAPETQATQQANAQLWVLSGRSQAGLQENLLRLQTALQKDTQPSPAALAAQLAHRRRHEPWRLSWVVESLDEGLRLLAEPLPPDLTPVKTVPGLVWVFPGQGGQWLGMGQSLLQEPAFAQAFAACSEAFKPWFPAGLEALLTQWQEERIDQIQPLLCAYQIALARLWQAWGIFPEAVIGHSMGEVAAAHIAGLLSLSDAACIICERSLLMQSLPPGGAMLLTDLSWEAAARWEKPHLVRAVQAGPQQTVLAGEVFALSQLAITLEVTGRLARPIAVTVASHSPFVDPILPEIAARLAHLCPQKGQIPMISTLTGKWLDPDSPEDQLNQHYWAQNLRSPVRFQAAIETAQAQGYTHFLEIGPHPVLAPGLQSQGLWAAGCGRRGHPERKALLLTLGELYALGHDPNWQTLLPPQLLPPMPLPASAWERQNYGLAPVAAQTLARPVLAQQAASQTGLAWQVLKAAKTQLSQHTWLLAGGSAAWSSALTLVLESSGLTCLELPSGLVTALANQDSANIKVQMDTYLGSLKGQRPALLYLAGLESPLETQAETLAFLQKNETLAALPIWYLSLNQQQLLSENPGNPPEAAAEQEQALSQVMQEIQKRSQTGADFYLCDLPDTRPASWGKLAMLLRQPPESPILALRQGHWWVPPAPRDALQQAQEIAPTTAENTARGQAFAQARQPGDLLAQLRVEIGQLLRLPASQLDSDSPLDSYGFDSLLAVELRQRLEKLTGLTAPTELLQRGISIRQIQTWLEAQAHSEDKI